MKYRSRLHNLTSAAWNVLVFPYIYLWGVIVDFSRGIRMDFESWFFGFLAAAIITIDVVTSLALVTGTWELLAFVTFWRIVLYAIAFVLLLYTAIEFFEEYDPDY